MRSARPVFEDDPLRLLRAVRIEDELGFRLDEPTEELVRAASRPRRRAGRGAPLGELERLSPDGFRRPTSSACSSRSAVGRRPRAGRSGGHARLRARRGLRRAPPALPVSNELRKLARTLLAAERPADDSPREIYRFRRRTEPWALSALAFLGATDLYDAVRAARAADHPEPLLRGDDVLALGIEPGPEVGRLLELVAEERAVGTIATRDEALDLVRRELGPRALMSAGTRRCSPV